MSILDTLLQQSATQWIALITGIIYVILAAFEKPLCWAFGIISCTLIAIDDFIMFQLYADGVLQIFYVLFGFLGLYYWIFRNQPGTSTPVVSWPLSKHAVAIAICIVLTIPLGYLLQKYTIAAYSYLDTFITLLSLWTTWLLVRKVLENWLYWIVIDAISIFLFWNRGGALIAILFGVYLAVAVLGLINWRNQWLLDRQNIAEKTA